MTKVKLDLRKVAMIIACLVATSMIFWSCKNKDNGENGNGNDNGGGTNKTYTAHITPADGWQVLTDGYSLFRYKIDLLGGGDGGIWCREPKTFENINAEIENYKNVESQVPSDAWSDVKNVKVNGYDAKQLDYSLYISPADMIYTVYFVPKDKTLFILICMSTGIGEDSAPAVHETLKPAYNSMVASFTITEK